KGRQARRGVVGGYASSDGWAINNSGQVAVGNFLSGVGSQSALWLPVAAYGLPRGMNSLGAIPGQRGNSASALNDLGQVVGSSDTALLDAANHPISHAYLWRRS